MAAVTVYHYPKCSTCKKAIAWLRGRGFEMKLIDIAKTPPSVRVLARIARLADRPATKMFNTSGRSYRSGGFKDRVATMSVDEIFAALAADGMLIKRPLVVGKDVAAVGFDAEQYQSRLG